MPSVIAVNTSGTTIILIACTNAVPTGASFAAKCGNRNPTAHPRTSPRSICKGKAIFLRPCCDRMIILPGAMSNGVSSDVSNVKRRRERSRPFFARMREKLQANVHRAFNVAIDKSACAFRVAGLNGRVDFEVLQHSLFRALGAVAFNAPQREAALIAQVSVGLPQPPVVGAFEHGVVECPANALRFVDVERT